MRLEKIRLYDRYLFTLWNFSLIHAEPSRKNVKAFFYIYTEIFDGKIALRFVDKSVSEIPSKTLHFMEKVTEK